MNRFEKAASFGAMMGKRAGVADLGKGSYMYSDKNRYKPGRNARLSVTWSKEHMKDFEDTIINHAERLNREEALGIPRNNPKYNIQEKDLADYDKAINWLPANAQAPHKEKLNLLRASSGAEMGKLAGLGTLAGIGLSRSGIFNAPDAAVGAGAGALIGGGGTALYDYLAGTAEGKLTRALTGAGVGGLAGALVGGANNRIRTSAEARAHDQAGLLMTNNLEDYRKELDAKAWANFVDRDPKGARQIRDRTFRDEAEKPVGRVPQYYYDTPIPGDTPSKGFGKASGLATIAAARILGRIGTATADMYGIDKESPGLRALAGAGTAGVIGGGLGALGGYAMPPSVLMPVMGKNKKPKVDKEGNPIKEETQLSRNQGALMIGGGLGIGGLIAGGLGGYLSNYR